MENDLSASKQTVYSISDFIGWQKNKELDLRPEFQRNDIWSAAAKSFLIDSIIRGLPTPIIFLREDTDIETFATKKQVVDGQQRLRTIFSYVDEGLLEDFNEDRDRFILQKNHNNEHGDLSFNELPPDIKKRILNYNFSVHVLPTGTADKVVLEIFSRLNSTGTSLNGQELRNARYYGAFRSSVYSAALAHLDRWRKWKVFSEQNIARMDERDLVSDLFILEMKGITQKTRAIIDNVYDELDEEFPNKAVIEARFNHVMDQIDNIYGDQLSKSKLNQKTWFYPLFAAFYNVIFGLETALTKKKGAALPKSCRRALAGIDEELAKPKNEWPAPIIENTKGQVSHKANREFLEQYIRVRIQDV